jgi:RimJ/RimL family protein N-acetyltransferase
MRDSIRPTEPLVGALVTLRQFTLDDVPAVTLACQDPEISRWTASIPFPYEEDHARTWISQHDRFWSNAERTPFAIVSSDNGAFFGTISFASFQWQERTAEAGYWVAANARGAGVATSALVILCDWGFQTLDLAAVVLHTLIGNVASERVAEKAGFFKADVLADYRHPATPELGVEATRWVIQRPSPK